MQRRVIGRPSILQQIRRFQFGQCANRAGEGDIGWRTRGFDQPNGDGGRIDLGCTPDGSRIPANLQRTQLNRSLGLNAEQRAIGR